MLRIMLLTSIAFVSINTWAGDEIKCNDGGNQLELNACARDDFAKADKELNQTYRALIKKEAKDTIFVSKLRKAQKAWLLYRDAELDAWFSCEESDVRLCWGSMYPISFSHKKAELTHERTKHLQQALKDGHGE